MMNNEFENPQNPSMTKNYTMQGNAENPFLVQRQGIPQNSPAPNPNTPPNYPPTTNPGFPPNGGFPYNPQVPPNFGNPQMPYNPPMYPNGQMQINAEQKARRNLKMKKIVSAIGCIAVAVYTTYFLTREEFYQLFSKDDPDSSVLLLLILLIHIFVAVNSVNDLLYSYVEKYRNFVVNLCSRYKAIPIVSVILLIGGVWIVVAEWLVMFIIFFVQASFDVYTHRMTNPHVLLLISALFVSGYMVTMIITQCNLIPKVRPTNRFPQNYNNNFR